MYYDTDITPGQGFYWNSSTNAITKIIDMKLEITKEKVLEAASKCPTAKETLKTLFPEAFEPTRREKVNKIMYGSANNNSQDWRECWVRAINGGIIHSQVSKIPGRNDDERVDSVILALAEKFNWS